MGRQLVFWKYEDGVYLDNQNVYEMICDEEGIDGLEDISKEDVLDRIKTEFSDYDELDEYNYESSMGSFTVNFTEQSVLFDCSYSLPETELNKMIDIMAEFDCPLYDPQIATRFDGQ